MSYHTEAFSCLLCSLLIPSLFWNFLSSYILFRNIREDILNSLISLLFSSLSFLFHLRESHRKPNSCSIFSLLRVFLSSLMKNPLFSRFLYFPVFFVLSSLIFSSSFYSLLYGFSPSSRGELQGGRRDFESILNARRRATIYLFFLYRRHRRQKRRVVLIHFVIIR